MFQDREHAARRLAKRLERYRGQHPLILAIPRGAVPMARLIASHLDGEMDVVLVRKLRAPLNEELAVGAIDENGGSYIADYAARMGANAEYLEREKLRQLETLKRRREAYTPLRPAINPAGRVVIVVDDGLATGFTMIAALHAVRARKPAKLVCAVPVASEQALRKVTELADEVICLHAPERFYAVGQFYEEFDQVSDDEVVALLKGASA